MKPTEFKITVSGAALDEKQIAHASAHMNIALLTALVGENSTQIRGPAWNVILPNGGKVIVAEAAERLLRVSEQESGE
ncbi:MULTISPECIES: hypothetical protein [Burkholderia]|uniref:Uncharacterized protein n=2 Tax=Burkholderia TaxID=32008 RepID=A0A103QUK1_9BURK|nr:MULTISPECIES: hypothetical protein [Burkholderia]AOJ72868.1 hypothetical protein WS78_29840 [Burkholderia savannae]AOJ84604.1 hypothetical protein WS86_29230 [Burkholderia savannae]AOK49171.1 hypothetical protein WT60_19635 [Burkholderia sp. MSMB617WGS]KGS04192.1 hypothetical protein X946_744 [Burkholderia sp. ABCPW 111]KVG44901.1 hypothetical protein WS77_06905 [Burkholderia sp. MSMB0265]